MKKKFVPILAAGALIVVIICFMLLGSIIEKYTPSKEHMNLSDYYNLSGEQDVALILDNQILDAKGKLLNGTVYLDYETVCSYLNDRFYWDHNENKLLYTTATDLISADADSTSYYVTKDSHSLDHPIVKADAQTAYIAIDFLKLYSDFSYEVLDSPNRVILTTAWGDYTTAPAKQKTQLRQKGEKEAVLKSMADFEGLPHRLQYVGTYRGVRYYDDSISTIPEAAINAAMSIPDAKTVLIGGMDRGINYDLLVAFIREHKEFQFICAYASGKRIFGEVGDCENCVYAEDLEQAVEAAVQMTEPGGACILSPAAASYGYFKNFEERGETFQKYVHAFAQ